MSDKKDIKIADAFKDGKAFIGFLTAGDPTIEKTVEETISQAKVSGLSFNPKDNGKDKFKIENLNYENGVVTFEFTSLVDKAESIFFIQLNAVIVI